MVLLDISSDYGCVIAVAAATFVSATWHAARTSSFRKNAEVDYPNFFASQESIAAAAAGDRPGREKALYLFNCAQRAHANFLEHYPTFIPALLISGLQYPLISSMLGVGWNVFRIMYAVGYTNPNKTSGKGRLVGSPFWLAELALMGIAGKVGYSIFQSR